MAPERLCWAADHSVADGWLCCAWVKWLRCTNKTATHTDSRDAYHPLWGCLTAGGVTLAGHIPRRLHTYCTYLFTMIAPTKLVQYFSSYRADSFLFGLLQTKESLSRFSQGCEKMGRKMCSLTNNSLYLSPSSLYFFLAPVSLFCSSWVMSWSPVLWVTFKVDINPALYGIVQR